MFTAFNQVDWCRISDDSPSKNRLNTMFKRFFVLVRLMSCNAAEVFRIPGGEIVNFERPDLAFFQLNTNEKINASKFVSKGKCTPFDKMYVQAKCVMTIVDGKIVFRRDI